MQSRNAPVIGILLGRTGILPGQSEVSVMLCGAERLIQVAMPTVKPMPRPQANASEAFAVKPLINFACRN
jgi:hypothetical protein